MNTSRSTTEGKDSSAPGVNTSTPSGVGMSSKSCSRLVCVTFRAISLSISDRDLFIPWMLYSVSFPS